MVLMGLGMGLISTPATESILMVLPPARAGVGSAVNDATREIGATLGVAVVGSFFSSIFGSALAGGAFGAAPGRHAGAGPQDSVAVAMATGSGDPTLLAAVQDAFIQGLHAGCFLVAAVCLLGAVAAAVALPGRRFVAPAATEVEEPVAAAV